MSDLRSILHSSFAYVRGTEVNKATAALTLDHIIQEQIKTLKKGETRDILDGQGTSLEHRPSRLDRLDALEADINKVVDALVAAGDDAEKLSALGIFEADNPTKDGSEPSATVDAVP